MLADLETNGRDIRKRVKLGPIMTNEMHSPCAANYTPVAARS